MSSGETIRGTSLLLPEEAREHEALLSQIAWFNRLRLLVAAGVIWLCALATHVFRLIDNPWPLYMLGAAIVCVDGGYIICYRSLQRSLLTSVRRHVYLQIGVDIGILTALLHFSGGITNPLALFYLFHAFIAALVLSVRAAVVVAFASVMLLIGLGFAEYQGWLVHHALKVGLFDLYTIEPLGLWLLVFAYVTTLAFSIYFISTVLTRLRRQEGELLSMGRHLALSEKLASVGTLAAGVSHEINNPIGVIKNKVKILRYRVEDEDSKGQLLSELDVVDKHVKRIAKITDGLLQFSRETPFELRPLDLQRLMREAADLVRVPFQAAKVQLRVGSQIPDDLVVKGSGNHLLQVLINILLNAKDASRTDSIVDLSCSHAGQEVLLEVRDHGQGIKAELLEKVFDPFFTTKDVDKGTGLGLAISHGIVARHEGRIEVDSEEGLGTCFRIVLPGFVPNVSRNF